MDIQTTIVAIIITSALLYVGNIIWRKMSSFSSKKSSCEADCGCEGKEKNKAAKNLTNQLKRLLTFNI